MYKKLFLLVVLTKCVLVISAQEAKQEQPAKKGCSCSFSSINQAGILNGTRGAYFLIQSINGVKYKTWFAGIGVGIDNYFRPGVPLFIDVRKYLFDKSNTPFFYADAGVHIVRDKNDRVNAWYEDRYRNGTYAEAGMGYKFGFHEKGRWLFSAGYSYKYVERRNVFTGECPTLRCYEGYYTYKNYLHRLSVKLGVQF
jgi:hypothetical protein